MNWVFWFLVVVALVLVWYGLRGLFRSVGRSAYDGYDDVMNIVTEEDNDDYYYYDAMDDDSNEYYLEER